MSVAVLKLRVELPDDGAGLSVMLKTVGSSAGIVTLWTMSVPAVSLFVIVQVALSPGASVTLLPLTAAPPFLTQL